MINSEDKFEDRFFFISDALLRLHMGDALRYATELTVIAKKYPKPLRSTFYKTSIIYLASIIEAALHFCVIRLGFQSYEKDDWSFKDVVVLHKDEEHDGIFTEIIAGKRFKKKLKIKGFIDFGELNRFCKDQARLYQKNIFDEVDKVRDLRNKIHLLKLTESDRECKKRQVDEVAKITEKVLNIVERKLKNQEG